MKIENSIRKKIEKSLKPTVLEIENESHMHAHGGPETHFKIVVVSEAFAGKSPLERHRMVQDLLSDERTAGLHALSQRTMTPIEWEKVKNKFTMVSPACGGAKK